MEPVEADERVRRIALTQIAGIGDVLAKTLVSYCGSVEAVFRQPRRSLEKIPGIGLKTAAAIAGFRDFEKAEKEAAFAAKHGIRALFYTDPGYPARLGQCMDAPILLYYKGTADLNRARTVAVVGTRNATDYGRQFTARLVEDLAPRGVIVISGLAYGIDVAAHKAALKHGVETVAVLGHGLDRIYPLVHKSVALGMLKQGGLLTEYPSCTPPDRENFPARNRIIAGLADAVVVVEAARSGGALITAEIANTYNRDVFALPGRVGETWSEGCNWLIKTNKAVLIESAKDLEYIMGWEEKDAKKKAPAQRELFVELTEDERVLSDLLKAKGKTDIDTLCQSVSLPMSKISAALLNLEFKGVLKALPGKMYELV
jgi:DNA processing protein